MRLLAVGCNFEKTPVEVRERLAFHEKMIPRALDDLTSRYGCEAAILSTCNRVEVYLGRPGPEAALDADLVAEFFETELLRTTIAALSQLDPALLDASYSLGGGRLMTFRRVTLPLIAPGLAAGAFLAFMASFDNVPVSLFLADERTEVLPIHLWQQIETNLDVRTAAVSGLIVIFTLILMLLAERLAGLTRQMR